MKRRCNPTTVVFEEGKYIIQQFLVNRRTTLGCNDYIRNICGMCSYVPCSMNPGGGDRHYPGIVHVQAEYLLRHIFITPTAAKTREE
jgi:hypothetical protein